MAGGRGWLCEEAGARGLLSSFPLSFPAPDSHTRRRILLKFDLFSQFHSLYLVIVPPSFHKAAQQSDGVPDSCCTALHDGAFLFVRQSLLI